MGYLESIMGKTEQILLVTRRHWLVIAGSFSGSLFLAVIITLISVVVGLATAGMGLLLLVLLVIPLGRLAGVWLDWWNDQFIITSHRIVQIRGVFNKNVIDSSLDKVNDVVMSQSFLGRLLGFGDIEILTASDIGVNKLQKIADPIRFKTTMLNAKEALESGTRRAAETTAVQPTNTEDTITQLIAQLANLRAQGVLTDEEFQAKKKDLLARL